METSAVKPEGRITRDGAEIANNKEITMVSMATITMSQQPLHDHVTKVAK